MRLLIVGGDGQVGREYSELANTEVEITRLNRGQLDITNADSIRNAIRHHQPQAVINCAAYTAVDRAESDTEQAYLINATAPALLAEVCRDADCKLLHLSTDYVFDGNKPVTETWRETDPCNPQSVYGASKYQGELNILAALPDAFILRTSWVFGRYGNNFVKTMLRLGAEREQLNVVNDQFGGPTHAQDIAQVTIKAAKALIEETLAGGIYHYGGSPHCHWQTFAEAIMQAGVAHGLLTRAPQVSGIPSSDYPTPAARPANSQMDNSKLTAALKVNASDWQRGLDVCLAHWKTNT